MLDTQGSRDTRLTIDRETPRMQDLRLVGVHEDGTYLLLTDDDGKRYRIPLDEALRAAARQDRPRLGQLQIEIEGGLRPKDVQAMVRAGLSAEEVAERAGWTVEKVHRYEGPILAEREHVANLARQVRLRARTGGASAAPTLGARVADRLRSRELDPDSTTWDSRRSDRGVWTVVLFFSAGGRQREALWDFDPLARTVVARDDEARWLSEDEDVQSPGPIPAPHLAAPARPSRVYDVEAEGGIAGASRGRAAGPVNPPENQPVNQPVDLMEAMRERSAQRVRRRRGRGADVPGLDTAPEDALPLEDLARAPRRDEEPPAAHGHPEDDPRARAARAPRDRGAGDTAGRPRKRPTTKRTGPGATRAAASRGDEGRAPERKSNVSRRSEETQPLPQSRRRPPAPADEDARRDQVVDDAEGFEDGQGFEAMEDFEDLEDFEDFEQFDDLDERKNRNGPKDRKGLDNRDVDVDDVDNLDELDDGGPETALEHTARIAGATPGAADRGAGLAPTGAADETYPVLDDSDDPPADEVTAARPKARPVPPTRPSSRPSTRKSGRPSVPSWDDIMFGRKGD
jgi:hypothetical protein